jgi:hypothetical protein
MNAIKTGNDVLAFLIELVAITAVTIWGFTVTAGLPVKIALGIGAPVVLVAFWAVLLAPTSEHRLTMPWLLAAKLVVFALASAALAASGYPILAAVLGALALLNLGLALMWQRV